MSRRFSSLVLVMGIAMGLGNLLSGAIERMGLILPSYIGAMIVAAVIRNLDDRSVCAHLAGGGRPARPRRALPLHRDGAASRCVFGSWRTWRCRCW